MSNTSLEVNYSVYWLLISLHRFTARAIISLVETNYSAQRVCFVGNQMQRPPASFPPHSCARLFGWCYSLTQAETFARHVGAESLWRGSWRCLEGESRKGYTATHWTENTRTTVPTLQTSVPEHFRTVTGHSRSHVSFRLRSTGDVTMHSVLLTVAVCCYSQVLLRNCSPVPSIFPFAQPHTPSQLIHAYVLQTKQTLEIYAFLG